MLSVLLGKRKSATSSLLGVYNNRNKILTPPISDVARRP